MNTTTKKLTVVVAMFISMVNFAAASNTELNTSRGELVKVSFNDIKKGSTLMIKNDQGYILYKEFIKIDGDYSKDFDLTELPNGSYKLELEDEVKIKILPFKVTSKEVEFNKKEEFIISKPIVAKKGDKVILSKLTLEGSKDIKVSIYYNGTDLVYKENLKGDKFINRSYDFSTSINGDYSIVVTSDGRTFRNSINIK